MRLSDPGIASAMKFPEGQNFTPAWRWRPFHKEYAFDEDILIDERVDCHAFCMTMYEVR